jgi:hypothetical protein
MANRLQRRNAGDNHWYLLDGAYVPGVTTALGLGLGLKFDIPSGWAARTCADWLIERRHLIADPAWTDTELHQMIRNAPRNNRDDAAAKGKVIHSYGELLHDTGEVELADKHAHLAGHINHYANFLDRWAVHAVASEVPMANTILKYAGTGDLIATSEPIVELYNEWLTNTGQPTIPLDAPGILDIKSGNGIRDKDKCQVVGYDRADLCHIDGVEQDKPATYWQGLIHVRAEFAELHLIRPSYVDQLWDLFNHALAEWHALDEKRGWISHATDNVDRPVLVSDQEDAA